MTLDPNKFYVQLLGGKASQKIYHRGDCPWVEDREHKTNFKPYKRENSAKYATKNGRKKLRRLCQFCPPAPSSAKPLHTKPQPTVPYDREPDGAYFFSASNGHTYHFTKDCYVLDQERHGGNNYGYTTRKQAISADAHDRSRKTEIPRALCPTLGKGVRDKLDSNGRPLKSCSNYLDEPPPQPKAAPASKPKTKPKPKAKPKAKQTKGKQTVTLDVWSTIWMIKPKYGIGATNLKYFAFNGAFFNRSKLSGLTPVKKLRESDFSEKWLVKIPVTVELEGDFTVARGPKSKPDGSDSEMDRRNTILLKGKRGKPPVLKRAKISGYPRKMGPSSGRFRYNTAGHGEAHGNHGDSKFAYKGLRLTLDGDPVTRGVIHDEGLVRFDYLYTFDGEKTASARFSFRLLILKAA